MRITGRTRVMNRVVGVTVFICSYTVCVSNVYGRNSRSLFDAVNPNLKFAEKFAEKCRCISDAYFKLSGESVSHSLDLVPITDSNMLLASWDQTRWLVLSSTFFIAPSIYAHQRRFPYHSALLLATSLASVNYWRRATLSWRRNVDIIIAKCMFVSMFYIGVKRIHNKKHIIGGFSGMFFMVYLYYLSGKFFQMGDNRWVRFHFAFHVMTTIEALLVFNVVQ